MNHTFKLGLSIFLITSIATQSFVCCMLPLGALGQISQAGQNGILFFKDGHEELILQIDYRIAGEKMPSHFAWIVTVPTEPSAYHPASPEIFKEVKDWARTKVEPPQRRSIGCGCGAQEPMPAPASAPPPLEFGTRAQVGPFDIQPVRARGIEALGALNIWLKDNGFPQEDAAHMAWFVTNKFTFLCVKVKPPPGSASVENRGELPPLHLSFKSDRPYYPLKFSSRQGVFELNLFVLSDTPFDYEKSADSLERVNWFARSLYRNVKVEGESFPGKLEDAQKQAALPNAPKEWFLNVVTCKEVNRNQAISKWTDDIFFAVNGPAPHGEQRASVDFSVPFLVALIILWQGGGDFGVLMERRKTNVPRILGQAQAP